MNKLVLIGAADSIGVPYSRDNQQHDGFFELIAADLSRQYALIPINCFHMAVNNDNNYIAKLIHDDYSIANIKNSQNAMLRQCKYSGLYPYIELPKSFFNHYEIEVGDEKVIIKDLIRNHDTIFIYSALVNDLLKDRRLSLFKLLRPGKLNQEIKNLDLNTVIKNMENNLSHLINLNCNIKIFIIGLFIPTKLSYIRKATERLIAEINYKLNELSNAYSNVYVVDNGNLTKEDFNNIDFHPNSKGHQKIYQNLRRVYDATLLSPTSEIHPPSPRS